MLKNTPRDLRVEGLILRRTNYGEADRILNIITPNGKISAIAKGARKEKSKLAGGIEMFSLADLNLHFGKSEFATLTGAKMKKVYRNIIKDLSRVELAAEMLKKINLVSESTDNPEYFNILKQSFEGIDNDYNLDIVRAWFLLNLKGAMGEEVNLYRDSFGQKLVANDSYSWDIGNNSFSRDSGGEYGANDIKLLRIMVSSKLALVDKVKVDTGQIAKVLNFVRIVV
ncbi:DNA repair protein RecO [Candidatus Saccharibacteria bacterium]|nr:DNA repair protein RecO [Candidatus Saccharibacteria bacterium]